MEGTAYAEQLTPIFARLNLLLAYLQGFDVKRKVYINPLGSLNDKFFRGSILFQCVFDSRRRDVFAAGGRYDSLVKEYRPKVLTSRSHTHAVGFNLSWDKLNSVMVDYLHGHSKSSLKQPEVEIGAFWKARRVSTPFTTPHFLLLIKCSATYLLLASTLMFCGLLE